MITRQEVQHIAKLARLGLTEKEIRKYQKDLSLILDYIEKLKEVDISKVEPFPLERRREMGPLAIRLENVLRVDESERSKLKPRKLLDLAPETKNNYLKVKKII